MALADRARVLGVSAGVLWVLGLALSPVEEPVWETVKAAQREFGEEVEGVVGQGLIVGLLGGFRGISADFAWLRTFIVWRKKDLAGTEALIDLTTSIDPRPKFFWIQGSHMIAFDFPHWLIRQREVELGLEELPREQRDEIFAEMGERALRLLDRGDQFHRRDPDLMLQRAMIVYHKIRDLERAAEIYRQVAEIPGAPNYAARTYAETLRELGRPAEAYAYYRQLYRRLPPEEVDPTALRHVVLERIRELEDELGVPPARRVRDLDG